MNRPPRRRAAQAGFTLIEMAVVILLIALVAAISLPQLLPILAFGEHETAARQLAGFGDAAMSHVTLRRDTITVHIDLDKQVIDATHLVDVDADTGEGEGEGEENSEAMDLLQQYRDRLTGQAGGMSSSSSSSSSLFSKGASKTPELGTRTQSSPDLEQLILQINSKFETYCNAQLEARANNIHRPDFLAEVGPLFDQSNSFSLNEDKPKEEVPVDDPLLDTMDLPASTVLESVWIDGKETRRGTVDIELSPLGLQQLVGLYLRNEDGDYYTIVWDPLNADTDVIMGKQRLGN